MLSVRTLHNSLPWRETANVANNIPGYVPLTLQGRRDSADITKVPKQLTELSKIIFGGPDLIRQPFKMWARFDATLLAAKCCAEGHVMGEWFMTGKTMGTSELELQGSDFCQQSVSLEKDLQLR